MRDDWMFMHIYSEVSRWYLILSANTRAWITPNGEYHAWIIVHYHYLSILILAINFFNFLFVASLYYWTKDKDEWFKHKYGYTKTVTRLSNWMTSLKQGVNAIHYFSHHIRADESRNTQFMNSAKKLEALLAFANNLYLVGGWNLIPMLFSLICDI